MRSRSDGMPANNFLEFLTLHATCGPIDYRWTTANVDLRCGPCGAVLRVDLMVGADAELLAQMSEALEELGLTEAVVAAGQHGSRGVIEKVCAQYPALREALLTVLATSAPTIH